MRRKKILIAVICIVVVVGAGMIVLSRNALKENSAKANIQEIEVESSNSDEEYTV